MIKLVLSILIVTVLFSGDALAKTVGIWYSTLYSKEKNLDWISGHGVGSQYRLTGDANGDGKQDSFIYVNQNVSGARGAFYGATSDGTQFTNHHKWLERPTLDPAAHPFLADVNGDGKADAVLFYPNKNGNLGVWEVGLSDGNTFATPTTWITGHGYGSQNQLIADVTGDGKADAVVYFDVPGALGNWYVSTSTGSSFNNYTLWKTDFGHGSQNQFLGDTGGDGKKDAVVFFSIPSAQGKWYNSTSNGTGFNAYTEWASGHGYNSNAQLLGDVNGDGKADAIVYFQVGNTVQDFPGSAWYRGLSDGNGFAVQPLWHTTHGNNVHHNKVGPANSLLLADVDGDGKQEPVAYHDLYTNGTGAGQWKVLFDGYLSPAHMNYWQALTIEQTPIGGQYDSGNPAVIQTHLQQISDAGIDFILIDLTNGVSTHQFILDRTKAVCSQLHTFNSQGHNLKYAIAIGKAQYSGNTLDVEAEAQEVLNLFVNDPTCGADYFKVNNVPLLESHFNSYAQKQDWLNLTAHSASNSFLVKYGLGTVPLAPSNAPSALGQGCGTYSNPTPPVSDLGNYVGWGLPYGTYTGGTIAEVMPGTNNKSGSVVKRTQNGTEMSFYTTCGWDRIQANKSTLDMVVINSYNEYAEETAVAPTDTSTNTSIPILSESWSSPSLYWDKTVQQISLFKN